MTKENHEKLKAIVCSQRIPDAYHFLVSSPGSNTRSLASIATLQLIFPLPVSQHCLNLNELQLQLKDQTMNDVWYYQSSVVLRITLTT